MRWGGNSLENLDCSRLDAICSPSRGGFISEIDTQDGVTSKSSQSGTQHQPGGTSTDDHDIVLSLLDGFMVRRVVVDVYDTKRSARVGDSAAEQLTGQSVSFFSVFSGRHGGYCGDDDDVEPEGSW
jgi:hypothetical protein